MMFRQATIATLLFVATGLAMIPSSVVAMGCGFSIGSADHDVFAGKQNHAERPVDLSALAPGCENMPLITVTKGNGERKSFASTGASGNKGRLMGHHFHGQDHQDGSSLEYIRHANGAISGSIVDLTDHTVTQLFTDANGNTVVSVVPSSDFPPEAHADDNDGRHLVVQEKEPFIGLRGAATDIKNPVVDQTRRLSNTQIDVLVVWTNHAECRNSNLSRGCTKSATTEQNMRNRIDLAIAETNTAYELSGITAQLNLVHAYLDASYTEASTDAFGTALGHLRTQNDGFLDSAHTLRTQYGADVVAMIIDDPQYCGIAYVGPRTDLMFSVTAWNCATGYYSFGHEIGHNMGANHDRGTKNTCGADANYNYGWRDPSGSFRSILAYNCRTDQCDNNQGTGCSRVQRFSNTQFLYNGSAMGDGSSDNARQHNDVIATVAAYYNPPATPSPTSSPTTTVPTTAAPTNSPTTAAPTTSPTTPAPMSASPTTSPTTASPTMSPTTAAPTTFPTVSPVSSCQCSDYNGTSGQICNQVCGGTCGWKGKDKSCNPK